MVTVCIPDGMPDRRLVTIYPDTAYQVTIVVEKDTFLSFAQSPPFHKLSTHHPQTSVSVTCCLYGRPSEAWDTFLEAWNTVGSINWNNPLPAPQPASPEDIAEMRRGAIESLRELLCSAIDAQDGRSMEHIQHEIVRVRGLTDSQLLEWIITDGGV